MPVGESASWGKVPGNEVSLYFHEFYSRTFEVEFLPPAKLEKTVRSRFKFCPPTGTCPPLTLPQPALPPTGNSIENLSPPTAGTPGMKINLVSQESENFVQSLVVDLIFYSPLLLNGYFKYSDFSAEIQKVIKYAFISRKRLVQLSGGFKRLLKFKFHTQGHECFLFIRLPKIWLKYSLYQK